jgi:hypothetical protein
MELATNRGAAELQLAAARADAAVLGPVDAKRQANATAQVLGFIGDALRARNVSAAQLFSAAAVEFQPTPGQRAWTKPTGVAPWELVRALAGCGVALGPTEAQMLMVALLGPAANAARPSSGPATDRQRVQLETFEAALRHGGGDGAGQLVASLELKSLASPVAQDQQRAVLDRAYLKVKRKNKPLPALTVAPGD